MSWTSETSWLSVSVDDSKFVRQFFVVAGMEDEDKRVEHSLLAIGRFNQGHIYKSAIGQWKPPSGVSRCFNPWN